MQSERGSSAASRAQTPAPSSLRVQDPRDAAAGTGRFRYALELCREMRLTGLESLNIQKESNSVSK